ncbi:MAG: MarR family transcriptional regulator, partial [Bacteroidota bacterium]
MKQILQGRLKEMNAGITVDQWLVLNLVETSADVSQQDICEELSKDAPTITRIIDLLEKKKLIKRKQNPNDRRKFTIALTKNGNTTLSKVTPAV